jgi:hypothetical protein
MILPRALADAFASAFDGFAGALFAVGAGTGVGAGELAGVGVAFGNSAVTGTAEAVSSGVVFCEDCAGAMEKQSSRRAVSSNPFIMSGRLLGFSKKFRGKAFLAPRRSFQKPVRDSKECKGELLLFGGRDEDVRPRPQRGSINWSGEA